MNMRFIAVGDEILLEEMVVGYSMDGMVRVCKWFAGER